MSFTSAPHLTILDFIVFCRFQYFYKFKVCGIHVYGCHFSNSICSLRICVTLWNSCNILNSFIFIIFVFMICDQWSLKSLIWLMEGSDNGIFSNKNLLFLIIFWCGPLQYCLFYVLAFWPQGIWNLSSPVQFSPSVMSDSLQPHEPQHTKPPCPSPTPRVHPNPCPLSWWCHPSHPVTPFSSCPQSFPESGSSQMSQLFASCGQSIGVSDQTHTPRNARWSPNHWTTREVLAIKVF